MKIIATLAAAVLMLTVAARQTIPDLVKQSFAKMFPGIKPKWEKEKNDYEAVFKKGGTEMSANFSADGKWLETETEIKTAELPQVARDYIAKQYKNAVIKEAARIEKPEGVTMYEAEVGKVDVMFDATGKFVKEEKE